MNSKVYIVYECGEELERTIGVCSSLELAEELKIKTLAEREIKCNISEEEYEKMLNYLYEYEDKHGSICEDEAEGVIKLFPNKNPKDIELIDKRYFSNDEYTEIHIEEAKFYDKHF